MFLCGGSGRRMFPITEDKFLLDFLGKSLLEHQIEIARGAGLTDFVIIGNPGNMARIEQITQMLPGARFDLVFQREPLGIADALKSARSSLSGPLLIVNPNDVFSGSAYTKIIDEAGRGRAASCMLGYRVDTYFPGGYLEVNSENDLIHIVEKPPPGSEPGDLVNILVHCHSDPEMLLRHIETVHTTTRDDVYECALDSMLKAGHRIRVLPYDDFWAPIKYPWHIFRV
ncbi:MAG: nucleotidyltransferase family protein, partial [Dehalococcoidia bacterium]